MKSVQIQLTTKCNQKCIMCRKYTWPHKEISIDLLLKKLEEYKEATFTFSGGDPLDYTELSKLNEYLKKNNVVYQVFTNLTYEMNEERKEFLDNAKWIQVSLDGYDRETYYDIRRQNGFDDLILNQSMFENIKFNCVISSENYKSLSKIAKLGYNINKKVRFFPVHTHENLMIGKKIEESVKEQIEHLKKYNKEIYNNTNLSNFFEQKNIPKKCYVKKHHRLIDEYGHEYPCCRAINDNGYDIHQKYKVENLDGIDDENVLYDFCKGCDRYVKFNKEWGKYENKEELFL